MKWNVRDLHQMFSNRYKCRVLVNYIYNIKSEVPQIDVIFQDALTKMIFGNNPSKLYIAILY